MTSQRTQERSTGLGSLKPLIETVGLVVAQLSVLGSVLVYFGTIASRVEARFFGLDPSQLDYSNQELLVRSIPPMLGPLAAGGVIAVLLLQLNERAATRASDLPDWRLTKTIIRAGAAAGLALLMLGIAWQWRLGSHHSYWSPLFLGAGAITLIAVRGLGAMLRSADQAALDVDQLPAPASPSPIQALDAPSKLVLGLVVVFAVFGFTARLAQADGFNRAVSMVSDLDERTSVSVLSEEPLIINRRGVACFPVNGSNYIRRYTGLHLVAFRANRYFLVPVGFDVNNGVMIVLSDADNIRIDYDATSQLRKIQKLEPLQPLQSPDPDLIC